MRPIEVGHETAENKKGSFAEYGSATGPRNQTIRLDAQLKGAMNRACASNEISRCGDLIHKADLGRKERFRSEFYHFDTSARSRFL